MSSGSESELLGLVFDLRVHARTDSRAGVFSSSHCVLPLLRLLLLSSHVVCCLSGAKLVLSFLSCHPSEVSSPCAHVFVALLHFSASSGSSSFPHTTFQSLFDYGGSPSNIPFFFSFGFYSASLCVWEWSDANKS